MKRQRWISQSSVAGMVLALVVGSAGLPGATAVADDPQFTTQFPLDECSWSHSGRNRYFTIQPGDSFLLKGLEEGEIVRVRIKVLDETKKITFKDEEGESQTVEARIVEEREWLDGQLVEVSRNYYARCVQTDDIYYFGEDVDIYEDGVIVSHDGAWLAEKNTGEGKALPGLIMPGTFLLGARYVQEQAPGVALDRAEHVRMGFTMTTPAGTFEECVEVKETTPLEPDAVSTKVYCAELGIVVDGSAKLIRFNRPGFDD